MPNGTQLLLPVRTKQLECERRLPYDIVQAHKEQGTSACLQTSWKRVKVEQYKAQANFS